MQTTIEPRMTNVVSLVPEAAEALYALAKSAKRAGLPDTTAYLVRLRASQINGRSLCAEMHSRELKDAGEPDERIEQALSALIIEIAAINVWNRFNVAARTPAGSWS